MSGAAERTRGRRQQALPINLQPRGLSREAAAEYFSIGPTLFDRMVTEGTMPRPVWLGGRRVWDVRALDRAFDALRDTTEADERNPWDGAA